MAQNISLDKIKTKRDSLVENFNSLQDKKKEMLKQNGEDTGLLDVQMLTLFLENVP